jgi:hypothetical protein
MKFGSFGFFFNQPALLNKVKNQPFTHHSPTMLIIMKGTTTFLFPLEIIYRQPINMANCN